MQLVISRTGTLRCLYSEAISLKLLGKLTLQRGSHVEPDEQGRWFADLGPVQGPKLGPFVLRSEALQAEQEWLEENWLE